MHTFAGRVMQLKGKTPYTELSKACGVTAATISKIARGLADPRAGTLARLVNLGFDMSLVQFYKGVVSDLDPIDSKYVRTTSRILPDGNIEKTTVEVI